MTLEVRLSSPYGRERIWPVNDLAIKLAELFRRKTFTRDEIDKLQKIGFKIEWASNYHDGENSGV